MQSYDPQLSLREAREQYFTLNGFDNGGYNEKWVRMRAGPIPIAFPNTKARLAAVKFHDLHHVLTEYETTWSGEAEIGAWEVATGCAYHYPAWLLNLYAFAIGLVISPRRVYQAFLRGRHSTNLYRLDFNDELLTRNVGATRRALQLNHAPPASSGLDRGAFLVWSTVSILTTLGTGAIMITPFAVILAVIARAVTGTL
jgi:hypothetical protein